MTVQEIKKRYEEKAWADVEALARTLAPTLESNAKRRREEEARKVREERRKRVRNRRKRNVNVALRNAGIPLRIL